MNKIFQIQKISFGQNSGFPPYLLDSWPVLIRGSRNPRYKDWKTGSFRLVSRAMIESAVSMHQLSQVHSGRVPLLQLALRSLLCNLFLTMDGVDHFPNLNEMLDSLPTLDKKLEALRVWPPQVIEHLVTAGIPQDHLPLQHLGSLSNEERTICYWTVMICWTVTGLTMVPREMQCPFGCPTTRLFDCHRNWERENQSLLSYELIEH